MRARLPGASVEFTPDTMRHVARLARIRLDDEEMTRLERDVEAILTHFDALGDGDASTEASRSPGAPRPDELSRTHVERADLLGNLPRAGDDGRIRVGRWE